MTESRLFYHEKEGQGFFCAKIENQGQTAVALGASKVIVYDKEDRVLYEYQYVSSAPSGCSVEPGDFVYLYDYERWNIDGLKADQIGRYELQLGTTQYPTSYQRMPCKATIETREVYGRESLRIQVVLDNNTGELIKEPRLVYAFYDQNHQLIHVGQQYVDHIIIPSGNSIILDPWINTDALECIEEAGLKPETVAAYVYYER